MGIDVELVSYIGDVTASLRDEARQVVLATAARVRDGAEARSAKDSGAQSVGIYIVSMGSSTYSEAVAAAQEQYARLHDQPFPALPEVAPPDADLEALVCVAAEYGASNEYERTAFLTPAAEAERGTFDAEMERIRLRGGSA